MIAAPPHCLTKASTPRQIASAPLAANATSLHCNPFSQHHHLDAASDNAHSWAGLQNRAQLAANFQLVIQQKLKYGSALTDLCLCSDLWHSLHLAAPPPLILLSGFGIN